jgi:transposase-like protein
VLVSTDGAPGLIRAVEEVFPKSLRQRCLAHKIRNLEAKVPAKMWRELKGAAYASYQAGSPKLALMAREDFVARYQTDYPSATKCFLDDFDACIAHLQLPISHRRVTRTTNLLERLFLKERRRTKTIPSIRRTGGVKAHVCHADPRERHRAPRRALRIRSEAAHAVARAP